MKKDKYYQIIRGICIIAVIIVHLLSKNNKESINIFNIIIRTIINFCVGIFIFISGYFVNINKIKQNEIKWVFDRLRRLGIPFLIFSTIAATIEMVRNKNNNIEWIIDILLGNSDSQLYYVVVLIQLIIITPLIVKIIERKSKCNIIVIIITPLYYILRGILCVIYDMDIPKYQILFVAWLIYYYIGIYYNINKIKVKKWLNENMNYYDWGSHIILTIAIVTINIILYKKV